MNSQLSIHNLSVSNFRCFGKKGIFLTFHPELTVLVARNGEGKTAILDAVKIALGTFTDSFPVTAGAGFHSSDAHIEVNDLSSMGAAYPISLNATGCISGKKVQWKRELLKVKSRTTSKDAFPLTQYGTDLYSRIQADEKNVILPMIAFYGTGRLWAEHKGANRGKTSLLAQTRFAGYENALSARSAYKQVKNWLLEALWVADSKTASESANGQFVLAQLKAIEHALSIALDQEGFEQLHYNAYYKGDISVRQKKRMPEANTDLETAHSVALPVSWLSDGVRSVFSMVADIAYRCVKLNPHLGERACMETPGIVMIDEVDIFLHPAWQQHILQTLRSAFPNIQFIVTTHSPQVVSAIPQECIRIIHDGEVDEALVRTEGARAEQILEDIFGVDARVADSQVTKDLNEYIKIINDGDWNSSRGLQLKKELQEKLSTDPVLTELSMMTHLKAYQRNNNEEDR